MVLKFKILAALFEGEPPILIPQNFVKFDLFVIFAYSENFVCLAYVVKKFEFFPPRLRGTPHFATPKLCQILSFLYTYVL